MENLRPLQMEILSKLRSSTWTAAEGPVSWADPHKDHLFSGNWEQVPTVARLRRRFQQLLLPNPENDCL